MKRTSRIAGVIATPNLLCGSAQTRSTSISSVSPGGDGTSEMTVRLRGREVQLETLRGQVDAVLTGRGGIVVVTGQAGMGKSALLAQVRAMAAEQGMRVFQGAGDAVGQVVPLGPLLEALVSADDPVIDPTVLRDLTRSPDQRFWLLREMQESLERAAMSAPLLVAVDDAQWADPATLVALGTLPRHLLPHRILWALAVRSGGLSPAVRAALARLEAADAVQITLNPLDEATVGLVAGDLLGGVPDAALLSALAGVRGQPFLLTELLRGLREDKLVEVTDGIARLTDPRLPSRFYGSVDAQLSRLSEAARQALAVAAVLGRRFSADELAALTGMSPAVLLTALREALTAGLITENDDRLAFRHDLVREAVDASLPRTVRQSLRRRAVEVMLSHGAPPADVAELVMEVAKPGDAAAIAVLRQAAAATGLVSSTVASLLSRRALDLTPAGDPGRGLLVAETIAYLVRAGQAAEALRLMTAAAGDLSDPAAEAEARLNLAILCMQYAPADVIKQCRLALERPGVPVALRVQLLSFMSCGFDLAGDVAAAEKPVNDAIAAARANGGPASEIITLVPQTAQALATGHWRQAIAFISEAVTRQHTADGMAARLWLPDAWKALTFIVVARLQEAFALIDAGLQAAQRDGISANVRIWSMLRCRALFSAGRLADAQAEAEALIAMADEMGDGSDGYVNHIGVYVLGRVALHTGDPEGLAQARRAAAQLCQTAACPSSQRLGAWLTLRVAHATGDVPLGPAADPLPLDPLGPGALPASSPLMYADSAALVRILLDAGKRREAGSVVGRLESFAGRHPDFPFLSSAARHARAVLDGDPDAALEAVALSAADPRPLVQAAVIEDAGRLLAASRAAEAVGLLETALAAYAAAGAGRDAARVRSLLRIRGVRPPHSGPRSAPTWPELTESEFAVVSLVAQGATNREVADRLYLSAYTVNSHLRHVFAKLGIRSRVELARLAAERGVPPQHGWFR
jgi:DNA-binding CsgD family transcriptional regulator